jgi:hypothetical protein
MLDKLRLGLALLHEEGIDRTIYSNATVWYGQGQDDIDFGFQYCLRRPAVNLNLNTRMETRGAQLDNSPFVIPAPVIGH